ncbi:pollen-specific leucine-rich repeat extensin-like protein 1 isoform X1 [Salmo trutta]|uniref:Zgc:174935 n=1 Tax=Salmo trutta TaxID=8032 RepID=A0A674ECX0_SALTR|nr:pollen-specific leucine-rich repeat extensin-like protein 1 isoform X1 [Salmo trutta]XP_029592314.1 pollen-specific leucine-rich repeat extensin-like protein 1 isoform X1 [Salmo trutta]
MMKTQGVLVGVSLLTSVALLGLINVRRKEEVKEQKHVSFETIKLRVTRDVLGEYQHEVIRAHNLLDKTKAQVDTLGSELPPLQAAEAKKKSELEACQGEKKHVADEVGAVEAENSNSKTEFEKQKAAWVAEVTSLKQQVEQHSEVCVFVKKDSVEGRKLCGDEPPKQEAAPKPDAPKPEESKPDAPKPDSPKEAPKQEAAPKPEEPKPDSPKEAPKQEPAPKPEEPKPDSPKEAPKQEAAPKPEEPKPEAPKMR